MVQIIGSKINHLKASQCVCGYKIFHVLVHPNLEGGAQVLILACADPRCGKMVDVSDQGRIGTPKIFVDQTSKNKVKPTYTVDEFGKKHYTLKCETGHIGTRFQKT
ncbi:hypothetical protein LCGC14_2573000 [marine sediment metagenome]|uniref:Uncharacterized protein n=1 Tax=marine sediment metagenome TaxID=412755 RepID=A0A0F9D9J1_9ZZZZ